MAEVKVPGLGLQFMFWDVVGSGGLRAQTSLRGGFMRFALYRVRVLGSGFGTWDWGPGLWVQDLGLGPWLGACRQECPPCRFRRQRRKHAISADGDPQKTATGDGFAILCSSGMKA